ncbi:sodium-coupled monocarboxylate transporter 1-like [Xenia sp. Carnegie-2017]|uniref:sodium-coupled monocarboxylate transporter 1-like n=1 Tax=Xenia sp. Carnegie-2017 TaxID=2897299 RepID=UPI001F039A93|nr:sodium-coupled monocarboxylate transporter 1-like [Xenia sp. Carnegie-2017]XP_046862221.1 sodium-coupled monocarboxylate transporter 1-like [Xenia sp. Carnegie-2017]XP_046862222.1 sodium-coupled monocarboxylate transporter 1-like [Xenia sp. Carnegie-2017]XP_046862223.1 sodium-coupled monocarboxylate transporter 1-like [Xenia sp. Carnegie-2017]XP_046862224.1 sodium-coupled monocarboxylate transporter 1-like [Xenia sp. Carnegie-2017]
MSALTVADYVIFSLMLCVSGAIGVYHAIRRKNQQTTSEFLLANQSISTFPIAISLLVSFLSAVAILGIPSEVYTYGLSYILISFAFTILISISAFLYVPVFYKMKILSTNEYLERRFSPGIRFMGSILFIMTYTMYLSIALFAPAVALDAVSDLPIIASVVANGFICVFYTSLGGFRAVIWTDVFQGFVILVGMITVFVTGTIEVNGFGNVWRINKEMKRLNVFDFNPDPTVRSTFWTVIVGGVFSYLFPWSVSQLSVQRFLASKSLRDAKKAILLGIPATIFIAIVCCFDGLVIFAVYHNCDLFRDKKITRNDQILPYFVVDKLGHLTGLPGLFIASLFSGSLSTVSSGINSLSVVILEDIVKKIRKNIPDSEATSISRLIGVGYGILITLGAIFLNFVKVPLLIQLTASLFNLSAGPLLGLFTLGMLSRKATWKGAYIGSIFSFIVVGWLYIGSRFYPPVVNKPPTSIEGCSFLNGTNTTLGINSSLKNSTISYRDPLARFYGLSFYYYGAVGMLVTIFVGYVFSVILAKFDGPQEPVDKDLLFKFPNIFTTPIHDRYSVSQEIGNGNVVTSKL